MYTFLWAISRAKTRLLTCQAIAWPSPRLAIASFYVYGLLNHINLSWKLMSSNHFDTVSFCIHANVCMTCQYDLAYSCCMYRQYLTPLRFFLKVHFCHLVRSWCFIHTGRYSPSSLFCLIVFHISRALIFYILYIFLCKNWFIKPFFFSEINVNLKGTWYIFWFYTFFKKVEWL